MNGHKSRALSAAIFLALGMGFSSIADAVGLGPIQVSSYQGEPLRATITVSGLTPEQAQTARVSLASAQVHRGRGIKSGWEGISLRLVPSGSNTYQIAVSSDKKVDSGFVNFVITLNDGTQDIVREYGAPVRENPRNAKPKPAVNKAKNAGNSAQNLDVDTQTPRLSDKKSNSPFANDANSDAGRNVNRREEVARNGGKYVVRRGDSLSSIARALRPSGVSTEMMMEAIYRSNPQAFGKNRNSLSAGATLTIPQDVQAAANMPQVAENQAPENANNQAEAQNVAMPQEMAAEGKTDVADNSDAQTVEAVSEPEVEQQPSEPRGLVLDSTDSVEGTDTETDASASLEEVAQQAVVVTESNSEENNAVEEKQEEPAAVVSVEETASNAPEQSETAPASAATAYAGEEEAKSSHGGLFAWASIGIGLVLLLLMISKLRSYSGGVGFEEDRFDDRDYQDNEPEEQEEEEVPELNEEELEQLARLSESLPDEMPEEAEEQEQVEEEKQQVPAEFLGEDEFLSGVGGAQFQEEADLPEIPELSPAEPVSPSLHTPPPQSQFADIEEEEMDLGASSQDKPDDGSFFFELEGDDAKPRAAAVAKPQVQAQAAAPKQAAQPEIQPAVAKPAAPVVAATAVSDDSGFDDEEDFFSELADNEDTHVQTLDVSVPKIKLPQEKSSANAAAAPVVEDGDDFDDLAGHHNEDSVQVLEEPTKSTVNELSFRQVQEQLDDFDDLAAADNEGKSAAGGFDFMLEKDEQAKQIAKEELQNEQQKQKIEAQASADAMQQAFAQQDQSKADEHAMGINLDLAAAYINSGIKPDKARAWLVEVMRRGTDIQKGRAQNLLDRLESKSKK
ncbi:MAG: LysM peptidoglycan-binding domain-containing protein [Cardiobacteriaceae bacterium]|nr:LysM peptidoglycan-binding domain-containing protein [Cardiobacteriaceae bacterium]